MEDNAGKSLFPNLLVTVPKAINLIVENLNNKEKLKLNTSESETLERKGKREESLRNESGQKELTWWMLAEGVMRIES